MAVNRIKIVRSLEGRFEESVIAYLFLVNILPVCIVPLIWTETHKFCLVLNEWTDFEVGLSIPLSIFINVNFLVQCGMCLTFDMFSRIIAAVLQGVGTSAAADYPDEGHWHCDLFANFVQFIGDRDARDDGRLSCDSGRR